MWRQPFRIIEGFERNRVLNSCCRFARDSGAITKVPETTACRALSNTRGKVRLPKRKDRP
jgi:hypothetical protein